MTRTFTQWKIDLGADTELMALTPVAFKLYVVLSAEPDLSAAGCLPWMDRRWAKWLTNGRADVDAALSELVAAGFVLTDEDTDEVLLRSFVRHDGRLNHKRWKNTVDVAAEAIRSDSLRDAVLAEISRGREAFANQSEPDADPVTNESESDPDRVEMESGSDGDRTAPTENIEQVTRNSEQPPTHTKEGESTSVDNPEATVITQAARIYAFHRCIESGARDWDRYSRPIVTEQLALNGDTARGYLEQFPNATARQVANAVWGLTTGQIDQVMFHRNEVA